MLEVMIVLLVMGVFITISASIYSSVHTVSTSFETRITNDLYYAQLYAMTENQYVTVRFDAAYQEYQFIVSHHPQEYVLMHVPLPENVELLETGSLKVFRYLPSGNTSTFGVVRFLVDGSPVNIHFYIAKGRFYVEKH